MATNPSVRCILRAEYIPGIVWQVQQRSKECVAGRQSNVSQVMKWRRRQYCDSVGVCQRDHLIAQDLAWLMLLLTTASGLMHRTKRWFTLLSQSLVGGTFVSDYNKCIASWAIFHRCGSFLEFTATFYNVAAATKQHFLTWKAIMSTHTQMPLISPIWHACLHSWCVVAGRAEILEARLGEVRVGRVTQRLGWFSGLFYNVVWAARHLLFLCSIRVREEPLSGPGLPEW